MTAESVCLTLIAARSFARSCSTISASSAIWYPDSRHPMAPDTARRYGCRRSAEQVKGHADEVMVRTILERQDAARLLARLKTAFAGSRMVYWIMPVTEFGVIDDHED